MNSVDDNPIQINQPMSDEKQTKQILVIRNRIDRGLLITHILNVKISNQPTKKGDANRIRQLLKQRLWDNDITQNIEFPPASGEFIPITIKWVMPNAGSECAYYYCVTHCNDLIVEEHVRLTIHAICNAIYQENRQFGTDWGAAYLLSKPLEFQIRLREMCDDVDDNDDLDEEC